MKTAIKTSEAATAVVESPSDRETRPAGTGGTLGHATSPGSKKKKDQSIETLRGLAVLLLVAAHIVGYDENAGLRVDDRSGYRYFYFSFEYFRMPLFTVISGFVYSLRPLQRGKVVPFLRGKVRRILLPLIFVSTCQYMLHMLPGVNRPHQLHDIWHIYIFPFDQFWFLQAIFLVFLTITAIDYFNLMDRFAGWLACCSVAMAACLYLPHFTDFFSFIGYLYLLPFFILGCGLKRHSATLFKLPVLMAVLATFIVGVVLQQMTWFGVVDFISTNRISILGILVGLCGSIVLFRYRFTVPVLAWLGSYAYAIFLFHVWGTAGVRMVAGKLGFHNTELIFAVSLVAGLLLPILAEIILKRNALTRRLFLGLR